MVFAIIRTISILLLLTGVSFAQCTGQSPIGTVCGITSSIVTGTWFQDINNSLAFGLNSSGSQLSNATALTNATTLGPSFIPTGTYPTNLSEIFTGSTWGTGQWSDSSGNSRAPWHYSISSAPTYTGAGFGGGITTAFNGDFTHVPFAMEMLIAGANTAGNPITSGYFQAPPNQIPRYIEYFTSSGKNNCTATGTPSGCLAANDKRTGQYATATNIFMAGGGDSIVDGFNIFVNGTSIGTGPGGILANPAGAFIGGSISTLTTGNIMEVGQITLIDNGVDAGGFGWNMTPMRTNANGANGSWYYNFRSQSAGTAPVDTGFQGTGLHRVGLDFAFASFPTVVTFTGTCSGVNVTVTGVTGGYLLNGSVLTGTGMSGQTLTAGGQQSGTPGGSGVYTASSSCTSSGSSITATPPWLQAAETLLANQRIYLNATASDTSGYSRFPSSAGGVYIDYNSNTGLIELIGATVEVQNLFSFGYIQTGGFAIASLPSCGSSQTGIRTYVTNGQTTPTFLGTVSSTGAVIAPVFCNGSAWVYG